jgi:hypothetical protein
MRLMADGFTKQIEKRGNVCVCVCGERGGGVQNKSQLKWKCSIGTYLVY